MSYTLLRFASFVFLLGSISVCANGADVPSATPHAIVATDGSGMYTTLQAAINAAPPKGRPGQPRFVIQIKPGIYKEKVNIPADKGPILLIGTNRDATKITWGDCASALKPDGTPVGTFDSPSVFISADNFEADHVTFENSYGKGSQAVAVRVDGDRAIFRECRFDGFQDTLLTDGDGKREYFENCRISGAVDFIFGASTCFFEGCELHAVSGGCFTAASTPQESRYGYVFSHCQIIGDGIAPGTVLLGRPWRPYAAVAYLHCQMDACVSPAGWFNWQDPSSEKTARYAEYHNTGPGARTDQRVPWSHQLSDTEAAAYTVQKVLGGSDAWDAKPALSAHH